MDHHTDCECVAPGWLGLRIELGQVRADMWSQLTDASPPHHPAGVAGCFDVSPLSRWRSHGDAPRPSDSRLDRFPVDRRKH